MELQTVKYLRTVVKEFEGIAGSIRIEDFDYPRQRCDGCFQEVGEKNPKGFINIGENVFLIFCNKCVTDQGLKATI